MFKIEAIKYRKYPEIDIIPSSSHRNWMLNTPQSFANRCLPLHIANEAGWVLLCDRNIELSWNGLLSEEGLVVNYPDGDIPDKDDEPVFGNFGRGIVSWRIPYVFKCSDGFDLLIRGPVNSPKHGISPLEGMIEASWLPVPISMNWQLTQPGTVVQFKKGEPFCMVVPYRTSELTSFESSIVDIYEYPEMLNALGVHISKRRKTMEEDLARNDGEVTWERNYVRGEFPDWSSSQKPDRRLGLQKFQNKDQHRYLVDAGGHLINWTKE
jgi:Family of unknown function (DUF6065)